MVFTLFMEAMASLNTFGYMLQWTNRIEEDAFERDVAELAENVRSTFTHFPTPSNPAGMFGHGVYQTQPRR